MNSNEILLLNKIYKSVLLNGREKYDYASKNPNIESAIFLESFSVYLREMNNELSNILNLTNKYAIECLNKATDIRKEIDINNKYVNDPSHMFISHLEKYKGISWADLSQKDDETKNIINKVEDIIQDSPEEKKYEHKLITYKTIKNIYDIDIGFSYKIPIINKVSEIPSAFYWFRGDEKNTEGIYTSLSNGFYIKVPFPDIIDATNSYNRTGSIRCKNNTYSDCLKIRSTIANKYKTDIRECTFAHKKDKYIKIGTVVRCPSMPHFGSHTTLSRDLDKIPTDDIKTMLMYSLSDSLISSLWFQKSQINKSDNKNVIISDIDIC